MSANVTVISENNKTIAESRLISITNIQPSSTGGSSETPTSIKTKYESNADTNAFTDAEKTNLANQSGTNTGDQDISGIATNAAAIYALSAGKQDALDTVTQAEAEAGTSTIEKLWTPERVKQAINALASSPDEFLDTLFRIVDDVSGFKQIFSTNTLTANRTLTVPDFDFDFSVHFDGTGLVRTNNLVIDGGEVKDANMFMSGVTLTISASGYNSLPSRPIALRGDRFYFQNPSSVIYGEIIPSASGFDLRSNFTGIRILSEMSDAYTESAGTIVDNVNVTSKDIISFRSASSEVAKIDASGGATISTLNISNIPTSSSGLSSGDVWNDAGTLKIVT